MAYPIIREPYEHLSEDFGTLVFTDEYNHQVPMEINPLKAPSEDYMLLRLPKRDGTIDTELYRPSFVHYTGSWLEKLYVYVFVEGGNPDHPSLSFVELRAHHRTLLATDGSQAGSDDDLVVGCVPVNFFGVDLLIVILHDEGTMTTSFAVSPLKISGESAESVYPEDMDVLADLLKFQCFSVSRGFSVMVTPNPVFYAGQSVVGEELSTVPIEELMESLEDLKV